MRIAQNEEFGFVSGRPSATTVPKLTLDWLADDTVLLDLDRRMVG